MALGIPATYAQRYKYVIIIQCNISRKPKTAGLHFASNHSYSRSIRLPTIRCTATI